jgi:hypothetical protein
MVAPITIEELRAEPSPEVKLSKARIAALKEVRKHKLKVIDARGLTPEIQRNWIDCLIFSMFVSLG